MISILVRRYSIRMQGGSLVTTPSDRRRKCAVKYTKNAQCVIGFMVLLLLYIGVYIDAIYRLPVDGGSPGGGQRTVCKQGSSHHTDTAARLALSLSPSLSSLSLSDTALPCTALLCVSVHCCV